jgi:hypothetical protein
MYNLWPPVTSRRSNTTSRAQYMARVIQYLQCAWRAENSIALKCFTVLSCCMCRQVEMLIQELVVLVQRSEEYTYFLTSHMRDAVNRDAEKQQAAAAQRQAHLQRRLSGPQPDTPATRDQKGVHERALVTFQNHVLKCFFGGCGGSARHLLYGEPAPQPPPTCHGVQARGAARASGR